MRKKTFQWATIVLLVIIIFLLLYYSKSEFWNLQSGVFWNNFWTGIAAFASVAVLIWAVLQAKNNKKDIESLVEELRRQNELAIIQTTNELKYKVILEVLQKDDQLRISIWNNGQHRIRLLRVYFKPTPDEFIPKILEHDLPTADMFEQTYYDIPTPYRNSIMLEFEDVLKNLKQIMFTMDEKGKYKEYRLTNHYND